MQGDEAKHSCGSEQIVTTLHSQIFVTYFLLHGIARFQLIQSAQVQDGICLKISHIKENYEL